MADGPAEVLGSDIEIPHSLASRSSSERCSEVWFDERILGFSAAPTSDSESPLVIRSVRSTATEKQARACFS